MKIVYVTLLRPMAVIASPTAVNILPSDRQRTLKLAYSDSVSPLERRRFRRALNKLTKMICHPYEYTYPQLQTVEILATLANGLGWKAYITCGCAPLVPAIATRESGDRYTEALKSIAHLNGLDGSCNSVGMLKEDRQNGVC